MKFNKKSSLSVLLSTAMVISSVPATVLAEDNTTVVAEQTSEGSTEVGKSTTEETKAASIGETKYDTLQAAVDAATEGDTITLTADVTENITIPENAELTIDLNGNKITNDGDHTITNNGTLIIDDCSDKGTGTIDNVTHGKAAIWNNGTMTVYSGTITRSEEAGTVKGANGNSYYVILNHGTMTIGEDNGDNDNIKVEADGRFSSLFENGWYDGNKNTSKENSVLTIYGGTYTGGINTVKNDDYGELTIEDGLFTNVAQAAFMNWNIATVNGGTFKSDKYAVVNSGYGADSADKGQLTITDGNFESKDAAISSADYASNFGNVSITGGTFKTENNAPIIDTVSEELMKTDYKLEVSGGTFSEAVDDKYLSDDVKYVAESSKGFSYAETLDKAAEAAGENGTVEIKENSGDTDKDASLYNVEYYKENLNGEYELAETTEEVKAYVGEKVAAEEKEYENYEIDKDNKGSVLSAEVEKIVVENGKPKITTLKVYYNLVKHNVTFNTNGGTEVNAQEVKFGGVAERPENPSKAGCKFLGWFKDENLTTEFNFATAIEEDTTVYAGWKKKSSDSSDSSYSGGSSSSGGGGGSSSSKKDITADSTIENGKVKVDKDSATNGSKVTVTVTPDEGYEIDTVTITDKNGKEVKLTDLGNGKYSFAMPSSDVKINAEFKKAADTAKDEEKTVIKMQIGNNVVSVDDKEINNDVAPVIVNDRTLVPIRIVTETLGGDVEWNDSTKTVTLNIDGKTITMTIGVELEGYGVAPEIINDRTYVPIRFVAEELGAVVNWNEETQEVVIEK
mgnify:CR=1 FL=1